MLSQTFPTILVLRINYKENKDYILQWAKSPKKKQSEGVLFLLIQHSKYGTILSKMHSYRQLFRR